MPDSLPDPLELARRVADRLGRLDGVVAVALGGSTARGEARPDSDLDLGIYYHPARPPSVAALGELARELDGGHGSGLVTGFGGWGPWINGGGWLEVEGWRMDWVYRDLEKVGQVFDECRAGRPTLHHQPGHPGGFHSHIYLGEVHHGLPLHDPSRELERLRALTTPYPPRLKHALVSSFAWQAGFALETSRKAAGRGDTFQVVGSFFGCAACLVQVLYALNERYFLNEKGAVAAVEGFLLRPEGFSRTVSSVLAHPGETPSALVSSLERLEELVRSVEALRAPGSPVLALHHAQITVLPGAEDEARRFYCGVLGLREVEKPASLAGRGGFWLNVGDQQVHVGIEAGVDRSSTRAHLAYEVADLEFWRARLEADGVEVRGGLPIPGYARFEGRDPFGNRLELVQSLS